MDWNRLAAVAFTGGPSPEQRQRMERRNAFAQFGTDPLGAEERLFAMGDDQGARALADRRGVVEQQQRRSAIGQVAQTQGYGAAQEEALTMGEPDYAKLWGGLRDDQREQALKLAPMEMEAVTALEKIADPAERMAAARTYEGRFREAGFEVDLDGRDLSDAGLARSRRTLQALAPIEPRIVQSGRYVRALDPNDLSEVGSYDLPQDDLAIELQRARIAATQAQVGQRQASAEASSARAARTRAGPAPRSGGGRGSYNPSSIKWD